MSQIHCLWMKGERGEVLCVLLEESKNKQTNKKKQKNAYHVQI